MPNDKRTISEIEKMLSEASETIEIKPDGTVVTHDGKPTEIKVPDRTLVTHY